MKSKITVRRAKQSQESELYRLGKDIYELTVSDRIQYYTRQEVREFALNKNGSIFLVALDGKVIIGSLFAKIISSRWCMCDSVLVSPKYRGKMIGNILMEKLFDILRKKGIDYVQGVANLENHHARKFFRSIGFKEGKNMVWLEKHL